MYHTIPDQEINPDQYDLTPMTSNTVEDECFDFLSKPRQTQTTIGLYLKRKTGGEKGNDRKSSGSESISPSPNRSYPDRKDPQLEKLLQENKGFWVDKPTATAPLVYKLREKYSVELPKKDPHKGQGIFYRPDYLNLDYFIGLGEKGLLYPEEEMSDSEGEVQPDDTLCLPLRKQKYKICDPCKQLEIKKPKLEQPQQKFSEDVPKLPFKKIPTGCQCDFFGDHDRPVTVWDNPYKDKIDMIRQHEMDKYLKPYKCELLRRNYEENPPVSYKPSESGGKRTFPDMM